ncbi:Tfx family DNA-binding protein [Palaeococcus ferrophilus]|uniref:Tfx family DNA-binding protein n=1 Tax=Palaeococcus ferrophilus TaxID=83868 RepID=UPI00064F8553|nr:Tfx family DNA-binding protein [Palaeococcus ferrophilus]
MVFKVDTFLTEQQIKILKLRARGLKQSEIAELLGTSRANVSILEHRAMKKIEKARNTLLLWEQINSRISVKVRRGEDVLNVPKKLFDAADRAGIHVPYTTAEVIAFLVKEAPLEDRIVKRDFTLFLDSKNRLRVSAHLFEEPEDVGQNDGSEDAV